MLELTEAGPEIIADDDDNFFGMGQDVRKAVLETFNIPGLREWQRHMLTEHLVEEKGQKNCLIVAPTSGGKTLVAIILLLRAMLVGKKDAILAMPYVAIVAEKVAELKLLSEKLPVFSVAEYAGTKGRYPVPRQKATLRTLYICTNEKAGGIWRFLCKGGGRRREEIGIVVIDEIHMIGDRGRGAVIEELVTSVLTCSGRSTRILGLSATIGNPSEIREFLGAGHKENCSIFQVTQRPKGIQENVVVYGSSFPVMRREDGRASVTFDNRELLQQITNEATNNEDTATAVRPGVDIMSTVDLLQNEKIQKEDVPLLWLKMNQHKQHVSKHSRYKLPHKNHTFRMTFPPVTVVPQHVTEYCRSMGTSKETTAASEISHEFAKGVLKVAQGSEGWDDMCGKIVTMGDPFAGRAQCVKQEDETCWDLRIIADLAFETMQRGESVIVFCPTRDACVTLCDTLTQAQKAILRTGQTTAGIMGHEAVTASDEEEEIIEERKRIVGHLNKESKGMVCRVLLRGIMGGIAYHSAALHAIERKEVEEAFAHGTVSVLCSTTTLAAGINLPASRVIIRSPTIGGEFITCGRYLQMVGRAGRTCKGTCPPSSDKENDDGDDNKTVRTQPQDEQRRGNVADSFIFIKPYDVGRFCELVDQHIEPVRSQLRETTTFYVKGDTQTAPPPQVGGAPRVISSVTRIILSHMDVVQVVKLSELIQMYKRTLCYQEGEIDCDASIASTSTDTKISSVVRTIEPLLTELVDLIRRKHLEVVHLTDEGNEQQQQGSVVEVRVREAHDNALVDDETAAVHLCDWRPWSSEGVIEKNEAAEVVVVGDLVVSLGQEECDAVIRTLEESAATKSHDIVRIPDIMIRMSLFATATSVGCISLDDAETFVSEASRLQHTMDLDSPLVVLYLTATEDISKPLLKGNYQWDSNVIPLMSNAFDNLEEHPDTLTLKTLRVTEDRVCAWLMGRKHAREDAELNSTLRRLWSAMFARDVCEAPEMFEQHCIKYGFNRGEALDLTAALGNRCNNLRNFCLTLGKLWWYPALAAVMTRKLADACDDKVAPLIVLKHTTPARAKLMLRMGLESLQDVAAADPKALQRHIPFLGHRRALQIIHDARMRLRLEAVLFSAEAEDRLATLK